MVKVVIAPGNGCVGDLSDCMWYGWIKQSVGKAGIECVLTEFPDPIGAHENVWLPFMRDQLNCDENTIVIGHSSGAVASMRLLENVKLAGVVLVSTYHSDLGDENEAESGYFNRPWNWKAIRDNAGFIVQFHSKNDHLVPVEEARYVHEQLQSTYIEHDRSGHFQMDEFPELLQVILNRIK